jgi:hypothetical protein
MKINESTTAISFYRTTSAYQEQMEKMRLQSKKVKQELMIPQVRRAKLDHDAMKGTRVDLEA